MNGDVPMMLCARLVFLLKPLTEENNRNIIL